MTVRLSHAPLRRIAWLGGVSASALMVAGVLAATAAHAAGTDLAGANLIENFNASMVDPNQPYTNSGAAATLTLQPNGAGIIVQENAGAIGGPIALTINGLGDVVLSGANTYTGGTTVQQGTLTLGSANALGSGNLTLANNTTLEATASTTVIGAITVNGNATFEAAAGQTLSLDGTASKPVLFGSPPGSSIHFGSATDTGTVVLNPQDLISIVFNPGVAFLVDGGTLKLGNATAANGLISDEPLTVGTGATTATLDLNGQTPQVLNLNGNANGVITNSAAALATLEILNTAPSTFAGTIKDGAGSVAVDLQQSTQILTGTNTYTGGTTISGNTTLQIGNGGTTGSIVGNVNNAGTLTFDRSNTYTFAGNISGSGALNQMGSGDLILTGNNSSYTGTATISAGTLTLGSANALGTGDLTLANGTTLEATASATITGAITVNGSATFEAAAGQTLSLDGTTSKPVVFTSPPGSSIHFGSTTDTGTVVLNPQDLISIVFNPGVAFLVDGGTLKLGNATAANGLISDEPLTVGTGATAATLDLNGQTPQVLNLSGNANGVITNSAAAMATLEILNTTTSTFAGIIKDGAGPVAVVIQQATEILTGTNTYTGGTTIGIGAELQIGNGGTTGSIVGNVTIQSNVAFSGALAFDRSNTYTFAGLISGAGAVQQNGTGTTILTNASTYTGATVINAGTLEIDGSIANTSSVTVNAGGKLSGTGLVDPPLATTTIMSGGTLAPGNAASPTGTLTIGGNLAFQSGAFYLVQLAGAAASNTTVGGTATLAGTVQASFLAGASNHTYDILHANGGLGGTTFSSLSLSNANFGASLSYTATDVFLNLTSAALGNGTPLNRNQQNVATVINTFFNNGGTLPANFGALFGLSGAPLANALTQLDGEAATGAQKSAFQLMSDFINLMLDPSSGNGSGGNASGGAAAGFAPEQDTTLPPEIASAYSALLTKAPPKPQTFEQRWSAWGSAFGGTSKTNGDPAIGSNTVTANDYGFAGGMDYRYAPGTVFGFAVAGGGTNWGLAQGLGSGRSDAAQAGIYAKTHFGPAYLSAALAFTNNWFTTNRTSALGDQLQGKFQGQSYGGRLEAGYRYGLPSANYMIGFTPYAAVQAQSLHTSAFSEADLTAGGFGLNVAAMNATDTRSELGLRADDLTMFGAAPLILRGRLAWAHDWITNPALNAAFQLLPGSGFTVNGAAPPKDSALTTVSAELRMTQNWSLLGKFDGQFGSGSQTYGGTGTLRYSW